MGWSLDAANYISLLQGVVNLKR